MATGNFHSMKNFPLIVLDDSDTDEAEFELTLRPTVDEMEERAQNMTNKQPFFKVTVKSGYYCGVQFYVEELYDDIESFTNDETQSEFGMCRSMAIRKYYSAMNGITRELRKAQKELDLLELCITARFSNGETIYEKVK